MPPANAPPANPALKVQPRPETASAPGEAAPRPAAPRGPTQNDLLIRAREAFRNGNPAGASEIYRTLLKTEPRNHAALSGLASLAIRRNDKEEAKELYRRILREDPHDSMAIAGLSSLVGFPDTQQAESRLKQLVRDNPEAAHLHFALGNVYVEQKNWREAVDAFFNAHRLDGDNADIAFNLAVSLDRLGQKRPALDFYRKALLTAGRSGNIGFDPQAVQRRIDLLDPGR
ncbi:MAG: tetratricopeptide repeat protein [Magnetococcales bacterium]|nr:tetratricopeptide repeat protein [Magnetococcales bacterium]